MSMGMSQSPGWFVKVINETIQGLEGVEVYLCDAVVFYVARGALAYHTLLPEASAETQPQALAAKSWTPHHHPDCIRLNADMVAVLTAMPMPETEKRVRFLLAGLMYYRSLRKNSAKRVTPIAALLKKGARFICTRYMAKTIQALLDER